MKQEDKVLRLIRGYMGTVTELSRQTEIERTLLGKKLKGKTPMTVSELSRIVKALGIDREELARTL